MAEYDPLVTMAALNMAIVSLHRITSTGDRVILDREYTGIINNLSMGEINADTELVSLYKEIMRVIRQGRLRDEDRAAIDSQYSQQRQKGIKEIVSGSLGKTFSTNPVKWLGRLAAACVSEYFRSRARAEIQHDDQQFRLRKEEIAEYDELQQKLVDAWKLLRQYRLQDKYVLTQTALDRFYDAVQEEEPSKRMVKLKYLDRDFEVYSPYWFYRGKAAQDAGDIEEARKCFGKFAEVWRPVLRRNPYKVEALKFRIGELMQEGSGKNREEILKCLADMKENTELEDWANNIYMGMIYFVLGMNEEAAERVRCNVVFGYETENSGKLLAKFESKTPPKKFAERPAKTPEKPVKTPEAPKPEPVGDSEAQYQLGVSCLNRGDWRKNDHTGVVLSVGLIVWVAAFYFMRSQSFWWNILIFADSGLLGFIAVGITDIVLNTIGDGYHKRAQKWLTKAAENGHTEAMYFLASIYQNERTYDDYEAIRWYKNAAVRGHIGAQKALREIYSPHSEGYMWAYLAYLCGGTENLGNKPNSIYYLEEEKAEAEAEAQKMYYDILRRKQNTNS